MVAKLATVEPSHGEPVKPRHGKLPEFGVHPLCSSRYCNAAARFEYLRHCPRRLLEDLEPPFGRFIRTLNHDTHLTSFACSAFRKQVPRLASDQSALTSSGWTYDPRVLIDHADEAASRMLVVYR